jgi:vitamin B12 transporter
LREKKMTLMIRLVTLACTLPLSQFALAADLGRDDIDQIIVTGARTPLTINQIGSALSVITREDIERRETRYVADLLRSVPGFSVSHTGVAGSQTQVRVRGAATPYRPSYTSLRDRTRARRAHEAMPKAALSIPPMPV